MKAASTVEPLRHETPVSRDTTSMLRLFLTFLRLGATAFGGPAMIAYIKTVIVERNNWLDEKTFRDGIVLSQSIPGATAMQIAAYVGLKVKGTAGALVSYIAFGLPGCLLMLFLSILYVTTHTISQVIALMAGLQVIVVAILAYSTYSFGKELHGSYKSYILALLSALLLLRQTSPFVVILGSAFAGVILYRGDAALPPVTLPYEKPRQSILKPLAPFLMVIVLGLAALFLLQAKLATLSLLMMKINLFAFGGGSSTIPLMFHEIVSARGWMSSKVLMDGIALGQVTPGPIVITSTFIGYVLYGVTGAIIATIAMFTPSFLVLLVADPYFDRLKSSSYFTGASKGILACFVGLLLFITLRFAVDVPWNPIRLILVIAALAALLRKVDILYVVLIGAAISVFVL